MTVNEHIIQRQVVELSVSREVNTLLWQQRFESILERELLQRLEPVFDRLAGPETWIEIDNLEIDLGELAEDWAEDELVAHIFPRLQTALETAVFEAETPRKSRMAHEQELLRFVLDRGYLPWWADSWEWDAQVQTWEPNAFSVFLRLLHDSKRRKRFVRQVSFASQADLLLRMGKTLPFPKMNIERFAQQLRLSPALLWEAIWMCVLSEEKLSLEGILVRLSLTLAPPLQQTLREKLPEALQTQTLTPSRQQAILQSLTPIQVHNQSEGLPVGVSDRPRSISLPEEGIYVPLAGMVLIHPFLPQLFDILDLVEQEKFVDKEAQMRTLHVLHYVCTGQVYPQEHELVIPKLLCGIPIEEPVERFVDLSKTEQEEAENMLDALLSYWEIMEGTTAEELRGIFLGRSGMLSEGELGWKLHVESIAFDVLLNQLPWSLSPIQLPWMEEMLWVEWG